MIRTALERFVAVAGEEVAQLLVTHAAEDRRVGDLVAVEMKDWQHRAVRGWVQELVGMPCRRERTGFGLAVANDTRSGLSNAAPKAWTRAYPSSPPS